VEVLENLCPLAPQQACLVIGAAGGFGAYAVQLAASQGARVTAVASAANESWVRAQGAQEFRAYETAPALQPGDAYDLIIDTPAHLSFRAAASGLSRSGMYVSSNPTSDLAGLVRSSISSRRAGYLMMLKTSPFPPRAARRARGTRQPARGNRQRLPYRSGGQGVRPLCNARETGPRAAQDLNGRMLVRSELGLKDQETALSVTWLDKAPSASGVPLGFGQEVAEAQAKRRAFLAGIGMKVEAGAGLSAAQKSELLKRDLAQASRELSEEIRKPYSPAPERGHVDGTYREPVSRVSGKFAVIER